MTEGMKTSEFFITALGPIVMVLINSIFGLGLSPAEMGVGTAGCVGYGVSRGLAK